MSFVKKHQVKIMAGAIFVLAFSIRAPRTGEGLPYLHRYDEPFITGNALTMMKTGDFNPHFFAYPSLLMYLNLAVDIPHYLQLMGQPNDAETYLPSLRDIKTAADTGWHWTISHPSFYQWNRMLTVFFGAGTAVLTFLLGLRIFKRPWVAVIPAVFLSVIPFHIYHSAVVSTDVPTGFFVLGAMLLSLCYLQEGTRKYLMWALIFCGLSTAMKYNSVLIVIPIGLALAHHHFKNRSTANPYDWLLLPVVPAAVFLVANPYAFFDMGGFLAGIGRQIRRYKIIGHEGFNSEPGWDHFWFQLTQFYETLGTTAAVIAVLGLCAVFVRRDLAYILIYPALFLLFMSQMRTNFHRNYIQIYPILALFFASGMLYLQAFLRLLEERQGIKPKGVLVVLLWVLTAVFLLRIGVPAALESYRIAVKREMRTVGIETINEMQGIKRAVIAKELRIHPQDLRKLKIPRQVDLITDFHGMARNLPGTLYVVPARLNAFQAKQIHQPLIERHRKYLGKLDKDKVVAEIGNNVTMLDSFSLDPGLVFYLPESADPSDLPINEDRSIVSDPLIAGRNWQAAIPIGDDFLLAEFRLSRGAYSISFDWKYSDDDGPPIVINFSVVKDSDGGSIKEEMLQHPPQGLAVSDALQRFSTNIVIRNAGKHSLGILLLGKVPGNPPPDGNALYITNVEIRRS